MGLAARVLSPVPFPENITKRLVTQSAVHLPSLAPWDPLPTRAQRCRFDGVYCIVALGNYLETGRLASLR